MHVASKLAPLARLARLARLLGLAAAVLAAASGVAAAAKADGIRIPFTKTALPNGLVVILSPDPSVPEAAVNVSYRVGSRMEREHRTGFAHLFEHLMFMGTRRAPTQAFDAWMEAAGGRNNAWTAEDRTDYFDVAPPTALPLLLWLEADRMRDLGPLIDQEKLDLQRDVVRNERRQSIENRPYGVEELELPTLLWPGGHPYHHPVIGAHEDLQAATVGDVKEFFATWYDPANASIAVTGDFDASSVAASIERLFGSLPTRGKPADPGAPGYDDAATTVPGVVRKTITDDVQLAKITIAWQSPRHYAKGDAELDLIASVLAHGKASRLYKALVYDAKIAQEVSAHQESRFLGSDFEVDALVRPGVDPQKVEKALLDQVALVRDKGVTDAELQRASSGYEMDFVDRLQSVAERASLLNEYEAEVGDPGFIQADLDRYRNASTADLATYAKKVLVADKLVVLTILPKATPPKKGGS